MAKATKLPSLVKGKHWTVEVRPRVRCRIHGKPKECWGFCDPTKRQIVLHASAERYGLDRETFIHEFSHKMMHWLDEDPVEHLGVELDSYLDEREHDNRPAAIAHVVEKHCRWMRSTAILFFALELDEALDAMGM